MNILFVSVAYAPFIGGAQTYLRAMAERLARDGHTVTVVTSDAAEVDLMWNPAGRRLAVSRETLNGVQVIRCPVRHLPLAPLSFYALRRGMGLIAPCAGSVAGRAIMRQFGRLIPAIPTLPATLRSIEPLDLIHTANISFEQPVLAAVDEAVRRRLPLANTPFVHFGIKTVTRNYTMPHQLEALRRSDVVFLMTQREQDVLTGLGLPSSRMVISGVGMDLADAEVARPQDFRQTHGLSPDTPVVLFVGALTYDKGAIHSLQAMQQLWANGSQARLALIGPAPLPGGFDAFFQQLPPEHRANVIRLGTVSEQAKQDALAACSLLVMPSRVDSFGIVYLEAWAHRKPVIGADAGGVPALIEHGADGYIVPFGDVTALADRISHLLAQPAEAARLGECGRSKVERRYTWDHIYDILLSEYMRITSGAEEETRTKQGPVE